MTEAFLQFLTPEERALCLSLGRIREWEPGATMISAGHNVDGLYVLLSGTADVCTSAGTVLTSRAAGDVLGEISLLDGAGASATVRAYTKTTALVLDDAAIDVLVENHPAMAARFYKLIARILAQRLRAMAPPPSRRR